MLTDKTKEAFKYWYLYKFKSIKQKSEWDVLVIQEFESYHFSMQYGIYVDFFDDNGIKIGISPIFDYGIDTRVYDLNINGIKSVYETRTEARKKRNTKS